MPCEEEEYEVKKAEERWVAGVVEQVSLDLQAAFPESKGFSTTNLYYMKQWYLFYCRELEKLYQLGGGLQNTDKQIDIKLPQVVGELDEAKLPQAAGENTEGVLFQKIFAIVPWGHHREILSKCKTLPQAVAMGDRFIESIANRPLEVEFSASGEATTRIGNSRTPRAGMKSKGGGFRVEVDDNVTVRRQNGNTTYIFNNLNVYITGDYIQQVNVNPENVINNITRELTSAIEKKVVKGKSSGKTHGLVLGKYDEDDIKSDVETQEELLKLLEDGYDNIKMEAYVHLLREAAELKLFKNLKPMGDRLFEALCKLQNRTDEEFPIVKHSFNKYFRNPDFCKEEKWQEAAKVLKGVRRKMLE